jgi:hypothetical protein
MIKFGGVTGEHQQRKLIGICLGRENMKRLLEGQPIFFKAEEVGVSNVDVLLLAAETETDAMRELVSAAVEEGASIVGLQEAGKRVLDS